MVRNRIFLNDKQVRILEQVASPGSSVAIGLEAWDDLYYRGFLRINRRRRYEITELGRSALDLVHPPI